MEYFENLTSEIFWGDLLSVVVKSLVSIIVLFLLTKLLGNKQISQLSFFDYAIGISIGSIAAELAVNSDTPFHFPIIAMVIFALLSLLASFWSLKSVKARRIIVGTPTTLIRDGQFVTEALAKSKIDVNELLAEARLSGYFDIANISHCIMESNGKFSFIPKSHYRPFTPKDANITVSQETPVANVIIDGQIMENNLLAIGKSVEYLKNKLLSRQIKVKDVLLATLSEEFSLTVYPRSQTSMQIDLFD